MWSTGRTIIREGWSEKIALFRDGSPASFADVITAWRRDREFRAFFIHELAAVPATAFFWEMPPIRRDTVGRPYEYVTIRSDALAHMPPDTHAFASIFKNAKGDVVTFHNLGGDALLVAPRPLGDAASHIHLAAFLRNAPQTQQHELFEALAEAIDQELLRTPAPVWISTSGLGVNWLHVRLDSIPKYYQYRPYAENG